MKKLILAALVALTSTSAVFAETNSVAVASTNSIPVQTVCDFLKTAGHYFLATTDGNQPRVAVKPGFPYRFFA